MVSGEQALPPEVESSIEKHALVNATLHDGRAEAGAVISKVLGEFPSMRSKPGPVAAEVREAVTRVNSMSLSRQLELLASKYPEAASARPKEAGPRRLPDLPGAVKGSVILRLPPEPSGFMHIGHAMAFTLNSLYKELYEGVLWLRFEDTNPKKVAPRYYDSFRQGISWLGIAVDHEKNVSQDMDVMYGYGRKLLERDLAYACSCGAEKVKHMRFAGEACEHRQLAPEESLEVWEELLARRHGQGAYVIRYRGDMKNANYSLRDPNIFRVIEHHHPVTGDRFTLWPTYDIANTIEDHICGVTHILRSSEFHTELQALIRQSLGLRKLEVIQFSRYNFKGTPVHKRLLRPLVEEKLVSGWDDPRMPTIEGVRRRGILPEAIREFTLQVGYTSAEHEYDWSMLFALNRKLLDPLTRRIFFVPDPVKLEVEGAPKKRVTVPYHPENDLGSRTFDTAGSFQVPSGDLSSMIDGTTFRLMDLYNAKLEAKGPQPRCSFAGDSRVQEMRKIQWVAEPHTKVRVLIPDVLYDDAGKFNPDGLKSVDGVAEESAASVGIGEVVQFPRFGFCRRDSESTFIFAHR